MTDAPRVTVLPLTAEDQDQFIAMALASRDLHHPWFPMATTPEQFKVYLARTDQQPLLIRVAESGELAGVVNFQSIIRGRFQSASISYAASAPAAGRGYTTEGVRLGVRYAFEELCLHRLEANIQPDNHSSLRLIQRIGFRREGFAPAMLFLDGQWRDHERWALINDDYKPHDSLPSR